MAEAPPETGHAEATSVICPNCVHQFRAIPEDVRIERATLRADVARLTEQVREWRAEAEAAGDRARAEAALRREVEAERNASLATAAEAAETVARLTAERDAARLERDSAREQFDRHVEWASQQEREARAQVWAEAIRVVEAQREPLAHGDYERGRDHMHAQLLAALRAAQERQQ